MSLFPDHPWWAMGAVDPGEFAMLRVEDGVKVLWNLCSAHGSAVDLIRGLDAHREAHAAVVVEAIIADVSR
jgi:hypothetical protein